MSGQMKQSDCPGLATISFLRRIHRATVGLLGGILLTGLMLAAQIATAQVVVTGGDTQLDAPTVTGTLTIIYQPPNCPEGTVRSGVDCVRPPTPAVTEPKCPDGQAMRNGTCAPTGGGDTAIKCPPNSVPQPGTRNCQCAPGYHVAGGVCAPVVSDVIKCPPNAAPQPGTRNCQCLPGYRVAGGVCAPVVSDVVKCPPNSAAQPGTRNCQCLPGYHVAGGVCAPIAVVKKTPTDGGGCPPNSIRQAGSTCMCAPGYHVAGGACARDAVVTKRRPSGSRDSDYTRDDNKTPNSTDDLRELGTAAWCAAYPNDPKCGGGGGSSDSRTRQAPARVDNSHDEACKYHGGWCGHGCCSGGSGEED
jgi:hypothetical protein